MVDEVGEPVDGKGYLDQGPRALLVNPIEPARCRGGADQGGAGDLPFVPGTAGLGLKDGKPVSGHVVRAMTYADASEKE
jgi:hypothetical protein